MGKSQRTGKKLIFCQYSKKVTGDSPRFIIGAECSTPKTAYLRGKIHNILGAISCPKGNSSQPGAFSALLTLCPFHPTEKASGDSE